MRTAERFAAKSTCKRRQHGAVVVPLFVNPTVIVGWNHSLDNEPCKICIREAESIPSGTQYEKCNAIHAEQDAICEAAKWHGNIGGATLYITGCPCAICAKMIVAAGIARVVIGRRAPQSIEGVVDYLRGFGLQVDYLADLEAASGATAPQDANEDCESCPNGGAI